MQVFLIRHGQSANNALVDTTQRVQDPELTEKGQLQAERVAAFVAEGGHLPMPSDGRPLLDRLYCSAMIRTLQTVTPIGRALGIAPQVWVDIHEVGGIFLDGPQGAKGYPGESRSAIAARFPDIQSEAVGETGWWSGGRETVEEGFRRAQLVAEELREQSASDERIGLVSHGEFMNNFIKALLGIDLGQPYNFKHYNTAITCITLDAEGAVSPLYVNRFAHLEPHLATGPG